MKKAKRIIALVLVMAFVVAFMAMSASAATTEVQPRAACPYCGDSRYYVSSKVLDSYTYTEYVGGCHYITAAHYHKHEKIQVTIKCPGCGYDGSYTYWDTTCV